MNVIIEIEGRQAIPVRAIPLLTDWTTMTPDEVADVLAGSKHHGHIRGLTAYRLENDVVCPITKTWWKNFPCRTLKAIGDRVRHTQISDESGYQDWRAESLVALPVAAFVWKDEYEPMYYRAFGSDAITFQTGTGRSMSEDQQAEHIKLRFDPYVPSVTTGRIVMEGFDLPTFVDPSSVSALVDLPTPAETKEQRQDRRLKRCEDHGLTMDRKALSRLPYGVGDVAATEGVTRQAFSADVKEALCRRERQNQSGNLIHRA